MDAVASLIERLAAVAPDGFARPELQSALRRLAPNIDLHEFGHVRALSRDSFLSDLAEVVQSASSRTHATIAIDDCQWLDRNSATVLTAALANPHNPVLLTTRPGAPEHVVEFLDAVSTGERFLLTGLDRSDAIMPFALPPSTPTGPFGPPNEPPRTKPASSTGTPFGRSPIKRSR